MSSNIKVKRICQHCKKQFTARTTVTKYCSDSCAKKAYKARKRKKVILEAGKEVNRLQEEEIKALANKDFLTISETCKLLSVSRWTIWRAIKTNRLNAAKFGRRTIIRRSDIESLFKTEDTPHSTEDVGKLVPERETEYYTISEAHEKFGISPTTLRNIIARKSIPKYKKGKKVFIPRKPIDDLFS
ncbi:helix-turn-helix domain-containing protein [Christiangramia salexigens]|uniref:Helix-turn-helix domain-containing protein n=1 Tax=Christiangramia salexigens TaxID=1913577 RepID=A0A1L3J2K2_9FLAO|nr:helix-turn-helix domain-containing protein [Christiangramia salexigens]APG59346.1 hypothetical protein LPB144_02485 [Christiangramia salexigens]